MNKLAETRCFVLVFIASLLKHSAQIYLPEINKFEKSDVSREYKNENVKSSKEGKLSEFLILSGESNKMNDSYNDGDWSYEKWSNSMTNVSSGHRLDRRQVEVFEYDDGSYEESSNKVVRILYESVDEMKNKGILELCPLPKVKYSGLNCTLWTDKVECHQQCAYGAYKWDGASSVTQKCNSTNKKWSPDISFKDCESRLCCEVTQGYGHRNCTYNDMYHRPYCMILCDNYSNPGMYKCDGHAKWSPPLPTCASPAKKCSGRLRNKRKFPDENSNKAYVITKLEGKVAINSDGEAKF